MAEQEELSTAKLPSGDGGGSGTPRERLLGFLENWQDTRERIRELKDEPGGLATNAAEITRLRGLLDRWKGRIGAILEIHPNLNNLAEKHGWNVGSDNAGGQNEPPRDPDDLGGQNQGGDGGGQGGDQGGNNQNNNNGNNQNGNNNPDNGGPNHDLLPGAKGKDFRVVKLGNGKYRILYFSDVPGQKNKVTFSYSISAKDLKSGKYGVDLKDVSGTITKEWIQRHGKFYNFGDVSEIKRGQGGNKHPFQKFLKLLVEQHPNASWLNSREVMRIMLQAKMEGRGSEWTDNMLRQTKWWQKRTEEERAWELTADAEQQKRIGEQSANLKAQLDAAFGPNVNWKKHITDDQLERWSAAVASGRISANVIQNRIMNIAQRTEGTSAWTSFYEEAQGNANSLANFDNALEFVRGQAVEWLGYHGRPDKTWLENQAKLLSQGKLSQQELVADLRAKKQALYRFLAPDETWQSRASSYKNLFEELTGETIGYDDKILRDFTARRPDGTIDSEHAMSLDEWDRWIRRNDKRWRQSDRFKDERSSLVNLIQQQFTGVGGGF